MANIEKNVIVSAHEKKGVIDLMRGLADLDYRMFATSGTARAYQIETNESVDLLPDLLSDAAAKVREDREITAQLISGKMAAGKLSVKLACLNLRPPRLAHGDTDSCLPRIDPDLGGISMIVAAGASGALVVTRSSRYDDVLEELNRPEGVDPRLRQRLQVEAHWHIAEHLEAANSLVK